MEKTNQPNRIQSIAGSALHLINSFSPTAAKVTAVGQGALNIYSDARDFYQNKNIYSAIKIPFHTMEAASRLFTMPLVELTTMSCHLVGNAIDFVKNREAERAVEVAIQALNIASRLYCRADLIALSLIAQCAQEGYKAYQEGRDGRYIEMACHLIVGALLAYMAKPHLAFLYWQYKINQTEAFQHFAKRVQEAEELPADHPLRDLAALIQTPEEGLDLGTHVFGYGEEQVKGMNLTFREKGETIELTFTLNHVAREELSSILGELKEVPADQLANYARFLDYGAGLVTFDEIRYGYSFMKKGEYTEEPMSNFQSFELGGVGRILVGDGCQSLHDRVVVQVDKSQGIDGISKLLSFYGVDRALFPSNDAQIERMKIGQLFRMFYPREALPLERSPEFFALPLDELQERICDLAPGMAERLANDLPKMELVDTLPGRKRFALPSFSDEAREKGALGLASFITSEGDQACQDVVNILSTGMLSSQQRYDAGIIGHGMSVWSDHDEGSADSVFTTLITKQNSDTPWGPDIWMLYSLDTLNTGTYQYPWDAFGTRLGEEYAQRPSLFELIDTLDQADFWNEVMVKETIRPDQITGILVSSQIVKADLVYFLEEAGIVDIPPIYVSSYFTQTMFEDKISA